MSVKTYFTKWFIYNYNEYKGTVFHTKQTTPDIRLYKFSTYTSKYIELLVPDFQLIKSN
jgi:hypothetical protein